MTNVSSLSLSANTSPRFFSRASSEVDEVCVHLQISASLRPLPLSLPPSLPPPLSPCRFSTHTHTQVEGALLRNVHHRVTSPRSRNNVTSPQRKATSLAAHSLDGRSPSKSKTHADKTGGGGPRGVPLMSPTNSMSSAPLPAPSATHPLPPPLPLLPLLLPLLAKPLWTQWRGMSMRSSSLCACSGPRERFLCFSLFGCALLGVVCVVTGGRCSFFCVLSLTQTLTNSLHVRVCFHS